MGEEGKAEEGCATKEEKERRGGAKGMQKQIQASYRQAVNGDGMNTLRSTRTDSKGKKTPQSRSLQQGQISDRLARVAAGARAEEGCAAKQEAERGR